MAFSWTTKPIPAGNPVIAACTRASDFSRSHARIDITTILHNAPQLHSTRYILHTQYALSWPSPLEPRVSPKYRPLKFPSGRSRETHETQPFQFLTTLSLQPSSVVTLVLSPTYSALYGTSFFPTPTRVSSARGTCLAPVSSASGIHAESRSHVRRKPRHVPIPPFIPSGEHSLMPGTIPH